ncbi:MAG TPA: hypothetical protein VF395_22585 [Polyangiaceae bacterium]
MASALRLVSLSAVLVPLARRGALSRMGRLYPWLIALGCAALFGLSRGARDVRPAAVVAAALGLMSWAAGAVALEGAMVAEPDDRERGLRAVATERGFSLAEQEWARDLATIRVVARSVALPGTLLALVAALCAPGGDRLALAVALVPRALVYAVTLGAVLGGIARLCARALPRYGRILFVVVVLGPSAWPSKTGPSPSIPAAFSAALHRASSLGGGASG